MRNVFGIRKFVVFRKLLHIKNNNLLLYLNMVKFWYFFVHTRQMAMTLLWCCATPSGIASTFVYIQGGPERCATTLIVNFKDIINKTELIFILLCGKFIFQQNDTMIINFG